MFSGKETAICPPTLSFGLSASQKGYVSYTDYLTPQRVKSQASNPGSSYKTRESGAQTVVSALVIDKSDIVDREEVQIVAEVRKADGIRLNIVAAEHRRVCNGYITADRRMTERVGNEAALIVADICRLDICCSRIADCPLLEPYAG